MCSLGAYISALIALIASSVSIEAKTVFIMRPLVVSADIANWIISCDKCVAPCLNEKLTHTHTLTSDVNFILCVFSNPTSIYWSFHLYALNVHSRAAKLESETIRIQRAMRTLSTSFEKQKQFRRF